MNFCTIFYGYILLSSYKLFAVDYIRDDFFITVVGSAAFVLGSLRFIWSAFLDKGFSYTQVYGILILIQTFCSLFIVKSAENN